MYFALLLVAVYASLMTSYRLVDVPVTLASMFASSLPPGVIGIQSVLLLHSGLVSVVMAVFATNALVRLWAERHYRHGHDANRLLYSVGLESLGRPIDTRFQRGLVLTLAWMMGWTTFMMASGLLRLASPITHVITHGGTAGLSAGPARVTLLALAFLPCQLGLVALANFAFRCLPDERARVRRLTWVATAIAFAAGVAASVFVDPRALVPSLVERLIGTVVASLIAVAMLVSTRTSRRSVGQEWSLQ